MKRWSLCSHLLVASAGLAGCGDDGGLLPQITASAGPTSGSGGSTSAASTMAASTEPTTGATGESTTTGDPPTSTATEASTSGSTSTSTTTTPPPSCGDGQLDEGEDCDDGNDDDTDECTTLCKAPTCDDGLQSGDESAIDCGGSCEACGRERPCVDDDDCESGACQDNQCVEPCPSWARQWGGRNTDGGRGIATDAADNVVAVGNLGSDGSVKKFDVSGTEQWADVLDSGELEFVLDVAIDGAGNVLVTGLTKGSLEGNPKVGQDDAFLIKYGPGGETLWSRQFGTIPNDVGRGVATDDAGNVVVVGSTYGDLDGNVSAGSEDLFVAKFDPQGASVWTRQLGTNTYDGAWGVAVGPNGSIGVVGASSGNFDGNVSAGQQDGIVIRFDANGQKQWSRQYGGDSFEAAAGVAIDGDDDVIVVGTIAGSLDGHVWAGETDAVVIKYAADGTKLWSDQIGGEFTDGARGVAIDGAGDIFVAGETRAALGGSPNLGGSDLFIVKYDGAGTKQWIQQFGTPQNDQGGKIALTKSGALVVVGNTLGEIDGPQQGGGDIFAVLRCAP